MPKVTVSAYPRIAPEGQDFQFVPGSEAVSQANQARSRKLALAARDVMRLVLPPADASLDELFSFRCSTDVVDGTTVVDPREMHTKLQVAFAERALTHTDYRYVCDQVMAIQQAAGLTPLPFPAKPSADGPEIALQFSTKNPDVAKNSGNDGFWVYYRVDSIALCEWRESLYPNDDGSGNPLYIGLDGAKGGAWLSLALQIRLT